MSDTESKLTTGMIMERLRKRYAAPAYGFLTEVGDATGMAHRRWADALAMSLYPSRGLELIGIEVKASRSDWVKERDTPAKAEAIAKYCDRWYLVVGDASIVKPGELPPTWGLIVPRGDGLAVKVDAPVLSPEPVSRKFLAAVFRRATEQSVDAKTLKARFDDGFKRGKETADVPAAYELTQLRKLREKVKEFEEASGVRIDGGLYDGEKIGKAVRMVLSGEHKQMQRQLSSLREQAQRIVTALDRELETAVAQ